MLLTTINIDYYTSIVQLAYVCLAAKFHLGARATRSRLYLSISDGAEGRVRAEGLLEVEHDERADAHHRHDLKRLLHLLITRATSECGTLLSSWNWTCMKMIH